MRADRAVSLCGELCGYLGTSSGCLLVPVRASTRLSYPDDILWTDGGE
jgi:hypothetical protein